MKDKQLMPDDTINIICSSIRKCIENGEDYSHYMRMFDKLNNGIIPNEIKEQFADFPRE
jgi:hypothetical protein